MQNAHPLSSTFRWPCATGDTGTFKLKQDFLVCTCYLCEIFDIWYLMCIGFLRSINYNVVCLWQRQILKVQYFQIFYQFFTFYIIAKKGSSILQAMGIGVEHFYCQFGRYKIRSNNLDTKLPLL